MNKIIPTIAPLKPYAASLVRHGLTAAGVYFAAKGVDASVIETFSGIGMTLFGLGWSILEKKLR